MIQNPKIPVKIDLLYVVMVKTSLEIEIIIMLDGNFREDLNYSQWVLMKVVPTRL